MIQNMISGKETFCVSGTEGSWYTGTMAQCMTWLEDSIGSLDDIIAIQLVNTPRDGTAYQALTIYPNILNTYGKRTGIRISGEALDTWNESSTSGFRFYFNDTYEVIRKAVSE